MEVEVDILDWNDHHQAYRAVGKSDCLHLVLLEGIQVLLVRLLMMVDIQNLSYWEDKMDSLEER